MPLPPSAPTTVMLRAAAPEASAEEAAAAQSNPSKRIVDGHPGLKWPSAEEGGDRVG
jgi:hypothetical protein